MIVADANLIAYLALPSAYTALAERLLLAEPDWVAPVLWRSEFRNVLTMYLRKGLISFKEALAILSEMEEMFSGREYEVASLDVLTLVKESKCSAYDCEYVALAKGLNVRLVTMDKKLARSFPDSVQLLTELGL